MSLIGKPSLSYSLDLSIPHPKSNQEVVLTGLKALSLWQSNVEVIKDVPFKDLKEGIEKIKHNF